MPGPRCARSRAWCVGNTRVSHHGHTGNARHSPRNGFNGFLRALPGDRACLPPSSAVARQLDTSVGASGPHDFAVRSKHRSSALLRPKTQLRRCCRVHRIPCPTFVTIAKRPSVGWDEIGYSFDLGQAGNGIFLREGLDRLMGDLPVGQNQRPVRQQDCSAD
jgi:hypothetical protein